MQQNTASPKPFLALSREDPQPTARRIADHKPDDVTLLIIRGLPGSGKTTLAKSLPAFDHFEADQFFTGPDGIYRYDRTRIADAHIWCQAKAKKSLKEGRSVVIANTFSRLHELTQYINLGYESGATIHVIETTGRWTNVHGIPHDVLKRMAERWEPYPGISSNVPAPVAR
jgi:hypothetical protein